MNVDDQTRLTIEAVIKTYTGTSPERIATLVDAVRYVVASDIPGSVVECGVWRGGSVMAAARTLLEVDANSRELWLYDTFEGMTEPTAQDRTWDGRRPDEVLRDDLGPKAAMGDWCYASLADVRANVRSTGYPEHLVHYVVGKVEDTIPETVPEEIAILRLDTDWYESTRHELIHLFPRVAVGGVVIIDDYGHWRGARKAVDEYLTGRSICAFLVRIDDTGRVLVKQAE